MAQVLSQSALDEWTKTPLKRNLSAKHMEQKRFVSTAGLVKPIKTTSVVIRVGVWDLQTSQLNEFQPPENTESLFNGPTDESVIGPDGRKRVAKKHLLPGGKYRGMRIVKLFLRFAGQQDGASWAMATGWLIEPDLLVTAGHCANDWSHNYGKLTHAKAYIGYTGKEAVSEANHVQMRMGIKVAAPESWLAKGNTDSRGDVSLIRLNKPFTGVKPFKYVPTPVTGTNEYLGVVGYPGDLVKRSTGEKGALMYEMFAPVNYTLEGSKSKMLQYTIDTFGGNSGSPVLRQSDLTSIGVHVLGGNPNSASVIQGKYGNSIDALKMALKRSTRGFQLVTISGAESQTPEKSTPQKETSDNTDEGYIADEATNLGPTKGPWKNSVSRSQTPKPTPKPAQDAQVRSELETFVRALNKAKKVTADPLGAIAAYGLHVAGMQARQLRSESESDHEDSEVKAENGREDSSSTAVDVDSEGAAEATGEAEDEADGDVNEAYEDEENADEEADVDEAVDSAYEGVAERAILTEAAFLTFQAIGSRKCKNLKYMDRMQNYVAKHSATVGRAGIFVFPSLMPVALQATLTKLKQQQAATKGPSEADDLNDPVNVKDTAPGGFGPQLDENREAILDELTMGLESDSGEAITADLSEIVSKGLRIPGAIVAKVASDCLPDLITRAENLSLGQETNSEGGTEAAMADEFSSEYLYDAMAQRALIGEAMLESILNTPVDVQREEGIFSVFKKFIKVVGGVVRNNREDQQGNQTESFWGKIAKIGLKIGKAVYQATKESGGLDGEATEGLNRADELTDEEAEEGDDWDSWISKVVTGA
ncbi:hypothetical protein E8E13_000698 [Curvularia kusanoi]|uniref:Serine protease n=1 Tax=Curvularia kusanoi TaxID=90978 RepID=A0A9P4TJ53_CURKU|nr:hypothetical protein E8E13_000698 [Curvularia kusanoi]